MRINWRLIRGVLAGVFVFCFVYSMCTPPAGRDHNGCWVHLATYHRRIEGRVRIIDTFVDRSGVGFYLENRVLKESYRVYSDELVKLYRYGLIARGDFIVKDSGTHSGFVIRDGKDTICIELLWRRPECDKLPYERQVELMRKYPVNFHDKRY